MNAKYKLLTEAEYDTIASSSDWKIVELDLPAIRAIPGIQRKQDLLGGFVSGEASAPARLNGQNAILGMDILVHEKQPKVNFGEGDINVYHYIITKTERPDLPYCLYGPFTKETLLGHWPPNLDMSPYNS